MLRHGFKHAIVHVYVIVCGDATYIECINFTARLFIKTKKKIVTSIYLFFDRNYSTSILVLTFT
jgi:hypothetical protein